MFGYYPELETSSKGPAAYVFFILCSQGITAVMFFFILSGFLVGGRTIERMQQGMISVRKYVIDRFFRISIPLFGAVLLIIVTNAYLGIKNNWLSLSGQFLGLQGVLVQDEGGVFWTLAYEIWFYIAVLGILLFCGKKRYFVGIAILAIAMGVWGVLKNPWLLVICCGILAYFIKDKIHLRGGDFVVLVTVTIVAFLVFEISRMSYIASYLGDVKAGRMNMFATVTFAAASALLISQIVNAKPIGIISKAFSNATTAFSKISYSLFLTHYQVLKLYIAKGSILHTLNLNTIGSFIGLCLCCIALACCFWWLFERNTRRVQNFCMKLFHL